jgi:uncharacterized protein (DUF305 family)
MNHLRPSLVALSASLLFVSFGVSAADDKPKSGQPPMDHSTMDHSKMGDTKGMHMKVTGDQDYDFASMMRHHHQMGLEMAQKELKNGKNDEMRQMAQKIVDAQKKEIATLDAWLAKNKPNTSSAKR